MRQWDAGVGCGLAIIFNQTLANAQSRFVKADRIHWRRQSP